MPRTKSAIMPTAEEVFDTQGAEPFKIHTNTAACGALAAVLVALHHPPLGIDGFFVHIHFGSLRRETEYVDHAPAIGFCTKPPPPLWPWTSLHGRRRWSNCGCGRWAWLRGLLPSIYALT